MNEIKLTAKNETERMVLDYLRENASDALAEKINNGTKTLAGALDFAKKEAQRFGATNGCVMVEDSTVFGWIIHFFEEGEIAEPKKAAPSVRVPGAAKPVFEKPVVKLKKAPKEQEQMSMLDALFGGVK